MMSRELMVCLAAGLLLAGVFYGGLWLTVRRLVTARHPAALFLGSLMVRSSAVVAGLLILNHGRWQNVAAILLGVVAGRIALTRYLNACA
jgi:F1F0 ATPase subunit 2